MTMNLKYILACVLAFTCLIFAGCSSRREHNNFAIIDPSGEQFMLVNGSETLTGPRIVKWNVWNDYMLIQKSAYSGSYDNFPFSKKSGYVIADTKSGHVEFFEETTAYKERTKDLKIPQGALELHDVIGRWRPEN